MSVLQFQRPTVSPVVSYAEASYFDGYHFQHIVARDNHLRLQRIERAQRGKRGPYPWPGSR